MPKPDNVCEYCHKAFSVDSTTKDPNLKNICPDCYRKLWDENFTSQAEYSDQQFLLQETEYAAMNDKLNRADIKDEDLRKSIQSYSMTTVKCRKCEKMRVSMKKYTTLKKSGRLFEELKKPCPKCKTQGFLYFS